MFTRRSFMQGLGSASASIAAASIARQSQAMPHFESVEHEMPRRMVLLSIRHADGSETLGARTEAGVVDVRRACEQFGIDAPLTLEDLLHSGNARSLNAVLAAARSSPVARAFTCDESAITHGRLFSHPSRIICVAGEHRVDASAHALPVPLLYCKYHNAIAAHGCTVPLPSPDIASNFACATELLAVIGRRARRVAEADALDVVAGYCTAANLSARDLSEFQLGASLDGFAPIGPYFVSADQVADPNALHVQTRVNGAVRATSSTADLAFNVQYLIAYLSRHWTLEPGDLIFTGVSRTVDFRSDTKPSLASGDEIVSSLEGLGDLQFRLA